MIRAVVFVPWRPQPSRVAAFERLIAWYAAELPDWEVRTIDTGDVPFNLAACRNAAFTGRADDDIVILNDADTIPERAPLLDAVSAAAEDDLVHLPYTEYRWLGAVGSGQYAEGTALADCDHEVVRGACSGVYVSSARSWRGHGGQDERFRGWGYEDAAWYLAHGTLLGAHPARHEGRVYALHHVPEVRAGAQYDANAALMDRYRAASDSPEAMRALIAEPARASNALAGPAS
ncbi:MAG: hypothetical protein ABWZ77_00410 [Naasia sp.]